MVYKYLFGKDKAMSANNNEAFDDINNTANSEKENDNEETKFGPDSADDTGTEKNTEKDDDTKSNNITDISEPDNAVQAGENNVTNTEADAAGIKRKNLIIKTFRILCTIGFVVFSALFINEVLIQPYKLKKSIEKARELYDSAAEEAIMSDDVHDSKSDIIDAGTVSTTEHAEGNDENILNSQSGQSGSDNTERDPGRDETGRLLKFKKLLEINEDVKGWIRITNINGKLDTKINYVVVQSGPEDPEFYLTRDWATKSYLKAGSIFLDAGCRVGPENISKNLIIHGHNMASSDNMFHYLIKYKELDFLKEHPVISFDTIYDEGLWKIFAVFITPGDNKRGDFFSFTRADFDDDMDFLEFVYQIRVRSLFNMDDVDINEDDRILTLSTCSYELDNYRIVIVARKVRDNENASVNTDNIKKNKNVLYPDSFYQHYGGEPPVIPPFETALENGEINWYKPLER